ncbi:MAG: DUF6293 family protein, partial [bacterium]
MGFIHVAAVGDDPEPVLAAVREVGADEVVLIGAPEQAGRAAEVARALGALGVETTWRPIEGDMLLGAIRLVQDIVAEREGRRDDVLVNLGAAGKGPSCACLSAAFVAGVKAIDRDQGKLVFLPVLQFSYREIVSEAKVALLRVLDELGGE